MLPDTLSGDLCSLHEGVDRPCIAVRMRLDAQGHKIGHRFVRGLMRSAASLHYAEVQQGLLAQGLMRTDGGGPDTPFTDRMLAETFIQIALYDEYVSGTGGRTLSGQASMLRRWEGPVRVGLKFGPSVSADKRATDTARVSSYLARLAQVTGHPIRLDAANPNFHLYIVSESERRALGPALQAALPGLGARDVAGITQMPRLSASVVKKR